MNPSEQEVSIDARLATVTMIFLDFLALHPGLLVICAEEVLEILYKQAREVEFARLLILLNKGSVLLAKKERVLEYALGYC